MKKLFKLFPILIISLFLVTGCGTLDPNDVDKEYVQNRMEKALKTGYGTDFVVNIKSFDDKSDKRESIAEAYPKVDKSLKFEITGSIEEDWFDSEVIGTSYHLSENFYRLIFDKINKDFTSKHSLDLTNNDYNTLAQNVREYMKEVRNKLNDYKDGSHFKIYFSEKYDRARVPYTKNGEPFDFNEELIIDRNNGKVVIDVSQGEYGWIGELDLEYYLELLTTDKLKEYTCNSHCEHYHQGEECTC